jgi:hypothetical protein
MGFVCPHGPLCREQIDGQILRPDGVHFDGPGGQIVARWLLGAMAEPSRSSALAVP